MPALDHVVIRVSDLDASITFYTKKLGLTLHSQGRTEVRREAFAFLTLEGGNIKLRQALGENNKPLPYCPPASGLSNRSHFAITVVDMAELMMRLSRKKVRVLEGPEEIPGEFRWLFVSDPDNNIIEFVQWL